MLDANIFGYSDESTLNNADIISIFTNTLRIHNKLKPTYNWSFTFFACAYISSIYMYMYIYKHKERKKYLLYR